MATADIRSAGARQLSPKLTVKIESQVWSSSWTRIAAEGVIQVQPLLGYSACIAKFRTAWSGANATR